MAERVPPEAVEIIIRETYKSFPHGVDQPDATDVQRDAAFISCNAAGHALMNVTRRHQQTLLELQEAKKMLTGGRPDQLMQMATEWREMCALIERLKAEATAETTDAEKTHISSENGHLDGEKEHLAAENARLAEEKTHPASENALLVEQKTHLASERARLASENAHLASESARLASENARLVEEKTHLASESARLASENARLASLVDSARDGDRRVSELEKALSAASEQHISLTARLDASASDLRKKCKDLERAQVCARVCALISVTEWSEYEPCTQAKHVAEVADLQSKISSTRDDLTMERLALERTREELRVSIAECSETSRKFESVKLKYLDTMRELQKVSELHADSLGYEKTKNIIIMLDAVTTKANWYHKHVCDEDETTSHLSAMLAYARETLKMAPSPNPDAMIRDLLTGSSSDSYRSALARMSEGLLGPTPCVAAYREFFAKLVCHADVFGEVLLKTVYDAGSPEEHSEIIDAMRLSLLPESPGHRCSYPSFIVFFDQLCIHFRLEGTKVATVYDAMYALREIVDRAATFRDDARIAESRFANEHLHNRMDS